MVNCWEATICKLHVPKHGKGILFQDKIKYLLSMCFNFKDQTDFQEVR